MNDRRMPSRSRSAISRFAQDAVADPDELHVRVRGEHVRGDGDDVVVALELEESSDGGEGNVVVGQPQLAADFVARAPRARGTRRRPCRYRR